MSDADVDGYLSSVWQTSEGVITHGLEGLRKEYFWLTEEEIRTGLDVAEGSLGAFASFIRNHKWLQQIRRMVWEKANHEAGGERRPSRGRGVVDANEGKTVGKGLAEKAHQALLTRRRQKKERQNEFKRRRIGRLKLDDALRQAENNTDSDKAFEGWSEARVKAFKQLETNPNAYFYRFNADGEEQDRGPWRPEEKELFLQRLKEMGPTQQWGIFSIAIPRRVGYQCSNFYRKLVMSGEVTDPNYVIDKDGKLRYRFANVEVDENGKVVRSGRSSTTSFKRTKSSSAGVDSKDEGSDGDLHVAKKPYGKSAKGSKQRNNNKKKTVWESDTGDDVDDDDDDGEEDRIDIENFGRKPLVAGPSVIRTRSGAGNIVMADAAAAELEHLNVLPEYIDPITQALVRKPAISKFGHVLGYDTWMKCFINLGADQAARCPLTNQKISKSDVTLLTFDNIEYFRDKICEVP